MLITSCSCAIASWRTSNCASTCLNFKDMEMRSMQDCEAWCPCACAHVGGQCMGPLWGVQAGPCKPMRPHVSPCTAHAGPCRPMRAHASTPATSHLANLCYARFDTCLLQPPACATTPPACTPADWNLKALSAPGSSVLCALSRLPAQAPLACWRAPTPAQPGIFECVAVSVELFACAHASCVRSAEACNAFAGAAWVRSVQGARAVARHAKHAAHDRHPHLVACQRLLRRLLLLLGFHQQIRRFCRV